MSGGWKDMMYVLGGGAFLLLVLYCFLTGRNRRPAGPKSPLCPYCGERAYVERVGGYVTCAGCRQRYRLGFSGGKVVGYKVRPGGGS